MNTVYYLLKLNRYIRNRRMKNAGVWLLHLLKKRYIAVFLDPVMACNLRCKMCYFSDPEYRKTAKGIFRREDLPKIAHAFFPRALKLQIGCGAEPSLFPYNADLIRLAKQYKVPYISMTTNANLFSEKDWWELVEAGLNEVTLSLHGVTRESYEYFMAGASFDAFCNALSTLTKIKKTHPDFKIRINYTVNTDNMRELASFFDIFGSYSIDMLQIRPIQKIGNSEYQSFSWDDLHRTYDEIIEKIRHESARHNVICIAPEKGDLQTTDAKEDESIAESTYCYISPSYIWREDFDLQKDTYSSYAKRTRLSKTLFRNIFKNEKTIIDDYKRLNYTIK